MYFGGFGWKIFVFENGLKVGDYLIFFLVIKFMFMVCFFFEVLNDNNIWKVCCIKVFSEFCYLGFEFFVSNIFMGKFLEFFVILCEEWSCLCLWYWEDEV